MKHRLYFFALIGACTSFGVLANAQSPRDLYTWTGAAPNNRFGISLDGPGDVNKDGYPDVVVGEDGVNTVHVFSGKDGSVIHRFTQPSGSLGWQAGGAGDMNQDGYADIIASAPGAGVGGSVWVWSGKDGKVLYQVDGANPGDSMGRIAVGLGDVNRDGFPDFGVSASGFDLGAITNVGLVRVISGKDGKVIRELKGSTMNEGLGSTLAAAGDVNKDGFFDLMIGSQWANSSTGFIDVISGLWLLTGASQQYLYRYQGPTTSSNFGYPASGSIGDLDKDGFGDFAISAPQWSTTGANGYVEIHGGKDGKIIKTIKGANPDETFGSGIANLGDLDQDGWDDIIISASGANGQAGQLIGRITVYSGQWIVTGNGTAEIFSQEGDGPYRSVFGNRVAGVGDVNKDGFADVLVTELWNPGKVYIISGAELSLAASNHQLSVSQFNFVKLKFFGGTSTTWRNFYQKGYWLLGSASGTSPGLKLGSLVLPLNPDGYTDLTLLLANSPNWVNFQGTTGAIATPGGTRASFSAQFNTAPLGPSLIGLQLHHAAVIFDGGKILMTTNAVPLTFVK